MDLLSALGLGILQGVAEFLPISSSGHLALAEYALHLQETPRFFDVMLHVATLLAVVVYTYPTWLRLIPIPGLRSDLLPPEAPPPKTALSGDKYEGMLFPESPTMKRWRMWAYLLLGTLPAVVAVILFKASPAPADGSVPTATSWTQALGNLREYSAHRPGMILCFLALTSVVLLIAGRARPGKITFATMTWWHVLLIGLAQGCSAVFPGLSRSGMTISVSLLLGLEAAWAVEFSLLLGVVAIGGAAVKTARDLDPAWLLQGTNFLATGLGLVVSAVVGWYAIVLLAQVVKHHQWGWFAIYLWGVIAFFLVTTA